MTGIDEETGLISRIPPGYLAYITAVSSTEKAQHNCVET